MRNPAKAPQLAEIAASEKLPLSIAAMDVDSDASVTAGFEALREKGAAIDVLVNNAGIERFGPIEEIPFEELRAVMETNYFGVLRGIRAVLPEMRRRRSGCIVNISSVAGHISHSPTGPYSASKFALEAASEALAQEVKPFNIRVLMVEPGIIDTPMARRLGEPATSRTYPQVDRFANLFASALTQPVPPSLVADKIREIVETGTWKLRHPVGPDAEPFLAWRAGMTDEQWVALGASSDEEWYRRLQADFGLDARPKS